MNLNIARQNAVVDVAISCRRILDLSIIITFEVNCDIAWHVFMPEVLTDLARFLAAYDRNLNLCGGGASYQSTACSTICKFTKLSAIKKMKKMYNKAND